MPLQTRFYLLVAMDVATDRVELLNEVYDSEHVPELLKVPGVVSVTRSERVPATLRMGDERRPIGGDEPRFEAIYEIESPAVLESTEWAEATERGRWATEVRPFTYNRRHVVREVISRAQAA